MFRAHPTVRCAKHGELPYEGHVVCTHDVDGKICGTSYTSHDETLSTHAPPRCRGCGSRLMPVPGADRTKHRFSGIPSCPECYRDAPSSMKGKHEAGDARCAGEECAFHGPQIRKLKKRAAQAQPPVHTENIVLVHHRQHAATGSPWQPKKL